MHLYSPALLFQEDRRFLGNQTVTYSPEWIQVSSNHNIVSLCFASLAMASLVILTCCHFLSALSPHFLFLNLFFGAATALFLFAGFLAIRLNQTTLLSPVSNEVTFFLNHHPELSFPFSQILQVELKGYSLSSETKGVVSLLTQENQRIALFEGAPEPARELARKVAELLRVPLLDEKFAPINPNNPETLLPEVRKHLKPQLLLGPLSIQVKKEIEGYELADRSPHHERSGFLLLLCSFVFFAVAGYTTFTFPELRLYLIPFFLLGTILFSSAVYFLGKKNIIRINAHSLRYYTRFFGWTLHFEEILLSHLQELSFVEKSSFKEITLRSPQKILSIHSNDFCSFEEMGALKKMLEQILKKYLPEFPFQKNVA